MRAQCQHDCARLTQSIGSLGIGSYCSWYQPSSALDVDGDPSPRVRTTSESGSTSSANASAFSNFDISAPEPILVSPLDGVSRELLPPPPTRQREVENTQPEKEARPDGRAETPTPKPPATVERHDSTLTVKADPSTSSDSAVAEEEDGDGEERQPTDKPEFGVSTSDRYFPLSTATMQTSVFDVVHIFSERGISAVPILDEDGVVLNMYETVDIVVSARTRVWEKSGHSRRSSRNQDLVRQNAYQVLDSTIEVALDQRSTDFTGVMTCTPRDSLASILAYIRERRCHRFVIIEPEDVPANAETGASARKKGSLVGILSLSDVLRYLVGHENLKGHEVPGLGVHGLRGHHTSHQLDVASLLLNDDDRDGKVSSSLPGSRRGSGATDVGSVTSSSMADVTGGSASGLGLEDVVE